MLRRQFELVNQVLTHLCGKGVYGDVTEWCEMRHDCVYVVTCPDCQDSFTLDEDEYDALVRMSQQQQSSLSCGIRPQTS